jgi:hypothetical protein
MEGGTFNRLVSEMSLEERNNLLEKLKNQSNMAADPLYDEADTPAIDMEEQYRRIPWYYHLVFLILGFFKRRSPRQIFEDRMVAKLGRNIDIVAPGFYDYHQDLLLPQFHKELMSLKEGARFFYSALDSSVNRDKGTFYSFLASLEMGDIHRRLSTETDPDVLAEKNAQISESELRQLAFRFMEDSMAVITEDQRTAMYSNARQLYCLKELSSFLFDRIILAFSVDPSVPGPVCACRIVKDQLLELNSILFSLKEVPSISLLESLFIFILQEHVGEPGFEIDKELRKLLAKAEDSVAAIRNFNMQVPLTLILRCSFRNVSLVPRVKAGGEDWFVVYREYWKRRVEEQFAEYMRQRRQRELNTSFRYFLKGTNLKILGSVVSDTNPNGFPVEGAFSLSFLLTFYSVVFMSDINRIIRPILIDGEFYKRENRTEFTESYNELIKLEDVIKKFEADISLAGDYGKRYAQARADMTSLPIKRRKIQIVLEEASGEAEKIIDKTRGAIQGMIKVLNGIIKKDPEGKYDTLANFAALAGKGTTFINNITESIQKFQKTLQLLDDIDAMESGR